MRVAKLEVKSINKRKVLKMLRKVNIFDSEVKDRG